jgi:hypothetical protein
MGWSREFDDPVPGMKTLRDAAKKMPQRRGARWGL